MRSQPAIMVIKFLGILEVLPNVSFTTSEAKRDYY